MSTPRSTIPTPVIVRGWAGEPVRLWAHGTKRGGKTVIVGQEYPSARPIGLPCELVYVFDESAWMALSEAFSSGKYSDLLRIYDACIMYQK